MRHTANFLRFNDSQRHALDARRNIAVRANAGSGKTTVLVEHIVQLLARSWDEGQPLRLAALVAITFTRKAAAELQDRLQASCQQMAEAAAGATECAYWGSLIEELPRAAIGTIDSFCAHVLREFANLDGVSLPFAPDSEPLTGHEEVELKHEAIDRVLRRLTPERDRSPEGGTPGEACQWWTMTQGGDALVRHLLALLNHVIDPEVITAAHQSLAPAEQRVAEAWSALPLVRQLDRDRASLSAELRSLRQGIDGLKDGGARLRELRGRLDEVLAALAGGRPADDARALQGLREALFTQDGVPRSQGLSKLRGFLTPLQNSWRGLGELGEFDVAGEVRALEAADRLVSLLAPVQAEYLERCRELNRYDFLTLARRTRDLLRDSPAVRGELKQRFRHVLVDEFQDTNQLQWEILSWLVGAGPDGLLDLDRLYIIGDPQQSIYRFRHADVSVFQRVQERVRSSNEAKGLNEQPTLYEQDRTESAAGAPSTLEQRLGLMPLGDNYRALSPMPLEVVDRVFRHVFDPAIHQCDPEPQPFETSYQPLRAGLKSDVSGEVRYVVPREPASREADPDDSSPEGEGAQTETLGQAQVRAVIAQLIALHGQPRLLGPRDERRPLTWSDMAVLLPSRTAVLTELESEFRRRRVPFVVTRGIGFWQRQEVRDVVSLASWLADSSDELALFAVLRGPVGQLSDTEILFVSQLGGGRLARGLQAAGGEIAGAGGLADVWRSFAPERRERLRRTADAFCSWLEQVDEQPPTQLLQGCLEASGAYALYATDPEGEQAIANLDRLFGILRAAEERSLGSLYRRARWLRTQVSQNLQEEQASLAAGKDAVQIMTVHAAKGLEFPVVAVMRLERRVASEPFARLLVKGPRDKLLPQDEEPLGDVRPGAVAVAVRHPLRPRETYRPRLLQALRRLDRAQQLAESRRLFYVAATRAQERLILAGREPPQLKDGRQARLAESWQRWFEESLGLREEHKRRELWEDAAGRLRIIIVTEAGAPALVPPSPLGPAVIDALLALEPIADQGEKLAEESECRVLEENQDLAQEWNQAE